MFPSNILTRPGRSLRASARTLTPEGPRHHSLLVLFVLVLGLCLTVTTLHACVGADGGRPTTRSVPSLRAAPVAPGRQPTAALAGGAGEPTLVILCQFSDWAGSTTQAGWDSTMFGPYAVGARSHRDYYREVSYYLAGVRGLDLPPAAETSAPDNNGVVGWYDLSWLDTKTMITHTTHPCTVYGSGWEGTASQWIARAAVNAADADVNFAAFDVSGDGVISSNELHITIILAGYEASYGNNPPPDTWRHHWSVGGVPPGVMADGVTLFSSPGGGYSMLGELDPGGSMIQLGLICHETGHDLGLPDLYDPSERSEGIGEWGLMGSGDWCATAVLADCPSHLDAWCKTRLGWIVPTVVVADQLGVNIPQVETNPVAYKLWSRGTPGLEYFLVENRQRVGYDAGLVRKEAADGLLVWHVNETKYGTGDNEDENEKLLDLECADGLAGHVQNADDLDAKLNRGDSKDPWYLNNDTDFYTSSSPDNQDYRKPDNFNTSVEVRNVSASGTPMTADLKVGTNTFLGSRTYTANGQLFQVWLAAAANTMNVYYLGYDCCGNTSVYEDNGAGKWVLVNTWNFNVPRHVSFVSGQEVRHQAGATTGKFRLASYSLCGSGCDAVGDAGYDVDAYDSGGPGGGSSIPNISVYPGWNAGFRDGLASEFGNIVSSSWSFTPDVIGTVLDQFPRRAGTSGVVSLHLTSQHTPGVYWEGTRLEFVVAQVTRTGTLTVSCPSAQYPSRTVNVTAPGYYSVDLGWIHPTPPGAPLEMTLSVAAGPGGADFAWDWLDFGTTVAPIRLLLPEDGALTRSGAPAFDWTDLLNATYYEIQADDDPDFLTPVVNDLVTTSTHTPPGPVADGFYYWRVRGEVPGVGPSDWAGPWRLRIDTQPPEFAGTTIWTDTGLPGPYPVTSTVTDLGAQVDSASLYYRYNGGPWERLTMHLGGGGGGTLHEEEIPPAPNGATIDYYLSAVDFAGNTGTDPGGAPGAFYTFHRTAGVDPGLELPHSVMLAQSRPNPFARTATIRYGLPREMTVSLDVYDLSGRRVANLASGRQPEGYHTVVWDGRSASGERVPSGVYLYRLKTGDVVLRRKLMFMH
jgi:M6 family metalloprotease-like protein